MKRAGMTPLGEYVKGSCERTILLEYLKTLHILDCRILTYCTMQTN